MLQPQPGQLQHFRSQPRIAGLRHALLVLDLPASPRRRRQAGVGARLSAVGEGAAKPLRPERGGEFRPDAVQAQKQGDGRRLRLSGRSCVLASAFDEPVEQPVSGALDRLDLFEQQFEPVELALDIRFQMLRPERPAVAGAQFEEPLAAIAAQERFIVSHSLRRTTAP